MDILEELGEGVSKVKLKLGKVVPPRVKRVAKASPVIDRSLGAFFNAMALQSAEENARPNKAYSLIASDPTVAIAAGATSTASFTLPNDAYVCYWAATNADEQNFLITSLKVAGFDVVGGSPINLASFLAMVNRTDRPGPLTGRMFPTGTTVEATVRNVNAAAQVWHGLTVWCISTDCQSTQKGKPAPSVLNFRALSRSMQGLFRRK